MDLFSMHITAMSTYQTALEQAAVNLVSAHPELTFYVQLCGRLAPVAAISVSMAPLPTILQIRRDRSVGDFPLLPYSSMIASAFVWTAYGILKSESTIWFPNGVGLVMGVSYFIAFIEYCPPKSSTLPGSVSRHMQATSALIVLCLLLATVVGSKPVGVMGIIFCVFLFASPLSALKVVLQTRSAKAIPLPFTLASVINCFLWSVTGLFDMYDYAIYLPNLLGLSFGLAQVALKLIYRSGKGPTDQDGSLPLMA